MQPCNLTSTWPQSRRHSGSAGVDSQSWHVCSELRRNGPVPEGDGHDAGASDRARSAGQAGTGFSHRFHPVVEIRDDKFRVPNYHVSRKPWTHQCARDP
jgi:hypothetical protein